MIDLHSHILPGIDDGSPDMETSVSMARMAVASGTQVMVCTPHIFPGLWENDVETIRCGVEALQRELEVQAIELCLSAGADIHIFPGLAASLEASSVPTLAGSRYFLLELPRHVPLPRIDALATGIIESGFVPIVTHPERLDYIGRQYNIIKKLNAKGCLMQITAGSVLGRFGRKVREQAMRLLEDGRVDIIASDAHDLTSRPPMLAATRDLIAKRFGVDEAEAMLSSRPAAILQNALLEPCGRQNRPLSIMHQASGGIGGLVEASLQRRGGT